MYNRKKEHDLILQNHYLDMSKAMMLSILDMGLSFFAFGFLGANDFGDVVDDDEAVGAAPGELDDGVALGATVGVDPSGFGFGFEVAWSFVFGFLIGLEGAFDSCEVASRFLNVESSLATADKVSL